MMRKRYSVSRRGLVLLRRHILFIIELLISKELFHQSSFYLNKIHLLFPATTLQRTISSIHVLFSQELFNLSSFHLSKVLFIIQQSSFRLTSFHFAKNYFVHTGLLLFSLEFVSSMQLIINK